MALDAVVEVLVRGFGQVVAEFVMLRLLYWPGWLILRVLTLGYYPPAPDKAHNRYLVAVVPLIALFIALTFSFS